MTAVEIHSRLEGLETDRALALVNGADGATMEELDDEIACMRSAFVGTAVVEIAILRAELSGPQLG